MAELGIPLDSKEQKKVFKKFKADLEEWRRQLEDQEEIFLTYGSRNQRSSSELMLPQSLELNHHCHRQLMSLDPVENFGKEKLLLRQTRQACPGKSNSNTVIIIISII